MSNTRSFIATSFGLIAVLSFGAAAAQMPAGAVNTIDGTLLLERADGSVKVLGRGSTIQESDRLLTRVGSRASITLSDHTALALEPDTDLRIEKFAFHDTPGAMDSGRLLLSSGQVHIRSGGLASRGAKHFQLITPTAAVDIQNETVITARYIPTPRTSSDTRGPDRSETTATRAPAMRMAYAGTDWGALFSPSSTPKSPAPGTIGPAPGLYVDVVSGTIVVNNSGGTHAFAAGQFGYVPSTTLPPVVIPPSSSVPFAAPPSIIKGNSPSVGMPGTPSNPVDCVVR